MFVCVCERDVYVYMSMHKHTYECVRVYVYAEAHTYWAVFSGNTKGQLPPAQFCFPWPFTSPAPHSAGRMENFCMWQTDQGSVTVSQGGLILSGRSEESLDPALCSSEQILPAARPQLAPKCSVLTSLCHRHSLSLGRKNNASDCLGVFCCFLFSVLWGSNVLLPASLRNGLVFLMHIHEGIYKEL